MVRGLLVEVVRVVGQVHNVHSRHLPVPPEALAGALDRLGCRADVLWPSPAWWPMCLHAPDPAERDADPNGRTPGGSPVVDSPAVGSVGGHGPIRYAVSEYVPGQRVRFRFDPRTGLVGHHEVAVEPVPPESGGGCRLRHVIDAQVSGRTLVLWPLLVRLVNDALLEDLLDRAELVATGSVARPARWSPAARLAHRLTWPRPTSVAIPSAARLARAAFGRTDLADAYRVALRPGMPTEPQVWARAVLEEPPGWVRAAMRARNALVGLVGIERAGASAFAPMAAEGTELLVGSDAGHLGFRVSVLVESGSGSGSGSGPGSAGSESESGAVVVSTVSQAFNRRGRAYLAVVGRVHPWVVRSMLRRGSRRLALKAAAAQVSGPAPGPGSGRRPAGRARAGYPADTW